MKMRLKLTDSGWRIIYVRLLLRERSLAIAVDGISGTEKRAPAHVLDSPTLLIAVPVRIHAKL